MSPPIRPIAGSQMAVFLINSRLGLLCATHYLIQHGPHFFRSYVCILPSSLTRVLSSALDFSSYPPVSVYGTVFICLTLDTFPGTLITPASFQLSLHSLSQLTSVCGFAYIPHQLTASTGTTVLRPGFTSCVLPSKHIKVPDYEPDSHRLRFSASP